MGDYKCPIDGSKLKREPIDERLNGWHYHCRVCDLYILEGSINNTKEVQEIADKYLPRFKDSINNSKKILEEIELGPRTKRRFNQLADGILEKKIEEYKRTEPKYTNAVRYLFILCAIRKAEKLINNYEKRRGSAAKQSTSTVA
jgi:ribosomal protein S17E